MVGVKPQVCFCHFVFGESLRTPSCVVSNLGISDTVRVLDYSADQAPPLTPNDYAMKMPTSVLEAEDH